jgi:TrmH family RNA methyltransferase
MITSTHNHRVQLVRSLLGQAKERREKGAFLAEGVRLVEEALSADWPFRFVLAGEHLGERGERLVDNLQACRVEVERVADPLMSSISATQTSQGILAVLDHSAMAIPEPLSFVLILDTIRDPGNLGTLLRTAAAAGVETVFLTPETADAFAPKVVRAGMGAHFHLPIVSLGWEAIKARAGRLTTYLADMKAALPCWEADFKSPMALIIGGEAGGASEQARELANQQVFIPMPGRSESLNAAAAGAIMLFEVVRQRKGEQRGNPAAAISRNSSPA